MSPELRLTTHHRVVQRFRMRRALPHVSYSWHTNSFTCLFVCSPTVHNASIKTHLEIHKSLPGFEVTVP